MGVVGPILWCDGDCSLNKRPLCSARVAREIDPGSGIRLRDLAIWEILPGKVTELDPTRFLVVTNGSPSERGFVRRDRPVWRGFH